MRELRYYAGRHKICGKICYRIIEFFQGVCLDYGSVVVTGQDEKEKKILMMRIRLNEQ